MSLNILKSNIFKYNLCKSNVRNYASVLSNTKENPGKVVFISQSSDIYSNLALEDWLYKNWDFSKRNVLLLWRNSPCVVIGRHQNPFVEANLPYLESACVPVIRRNSGGGTVYHDDGNLNCTFFTTRERYNRLWNLNLICTALKEDFNVAAKINKKDDIVVENNLKISGTAAKLGRLSAYHHCTLLVNADRQQLKLSLKGDKTMKSKATVSIPSPITNLQDLVPDMTVEKLLGSIGKNFLQQSYSKERSEMSSYNNSDGFTLINPQEDWFPGIDSTKHHLKSWEWFYGMTPHFKQMRPITIDQSYSEGSAVLISVEVFHGIVKNLKVESCIGQSFKNFIEKHIGKSMIGTRYSPDLFMDIESRLIEKEIPQYSSSR